MNDAALFVARYVIWLKLRWPSKLRHNGGEFKDEEEIVNLKF